MIDAHKRPMCILEKIIICITKKLENLHLHVYCIGELKRLIHKKTDV